MQPIRHDTKDLSRRPGGHLAGPSQEEGLDHSSRLHVRAAERVKHHRREGDVMEITQVTVLRHVGVMSMLEAACSGGGLGAPVDLPV